MSKAQLLADLEAAKKNPIDNFGRPVEEAADTGLVTDDTEIKDTNFQKAQDKKAEKKEEEYVVQIVDDHGEATGELFTKEGEEIKEAEEQKQTPNKETTKETKDELNKDRQEYSDRLKLLEEQNEVLKDLLNNAANQQQEQQPQQQTNVVEDDYDPFDKDSVDKYIQNRLKQSIDERLKPVEDMVYNDAYDRSDKAVREKYDGMYNPERDEEGVVAIRKKFPGLSQEDAFKIYNHDRLMEKGTQQTKKEQELAAIGGMPTVGAGTRHLAPKGKVVQLTKDQLLAARLTGCTPEEYAANMDQVRSR